MWQFPQASDSSLAAKPVSAPRFTPAQGPHAMTKETIREKRRYERARVSMNINWGLTRQCEMDARITSISQGGCFIQTRFELLIDQVIFLRLVLRTEHVLQCRTRYTLHDVGSGVAFIALADDERQAVQELVDSYKTTPDT